eukprot:TRINITY_DN2588_c0_g4_i1.p1 TRINITY_DN2588_c0_g4~~TRINITY_DN2588_c0_g4_i1.p1  ORF type:complete len:124 (+),score=23.68 TRINITY_DN2588_c0_g4_i1:184-555(+)
MTTAPSQNITSPAEPSGNLTAPADPPTEIGDELSTASLIALVLCSVFFLGMVGLAAWAWYVNRPPRCVPTDFVDPSVLQAMMQISDVGAAEPGADSMQEKNARAGKRPRIGGAGKKIAAMVQP